MGASLGHYRKLENGQRDLTMHWIEAAADAFGVAPADIIGESYSVPVMGYVGAGAEVEPDFEQVPPDGLDQVEIPFRLPGEMIALEVRGDSMLPRYHDGDVLIVFRDQRRGLESFIGEEAVVRTADGRRYVKTIRRAGNGYELHSFNASPMPMKGFQWIGEIYLSMPRAQIRRDKS